jgi:ABC-type antimicrobial peptide transport system permease subunit
MIRHHLIVAFRNIFRNKVFSLITTTGLSIGMTTFVLILLWVMDEMNFDTFHANIDRMYCIIERQDYSEGQVLHTNNTPFALKEELQTNYPEVANVTRTLWMGNRPMSHEEKVINAGPIAFVDPEFMEVFSFKQLSGDPNALIEPNKILITEEVAQSFFGDEDPLGKILQMDGAFDFEVGGILQNIPENSTFQFNILVPFVQMEKIFERDLNSWGNNWPRTTLVLKEDASPAAFEEKIKDLCKEHDQENTTLFIKAFADDHLYSNSGENNRIQYVYLFLAIGMIVLLIASVNFVNLSTAVSERRAKEVGIRKVIGANRWSLINQFFGEKTILIFISLLLSILLTILLIPLFNEISGKQLVFNLFENPILIFLFLGVGILSTILSGIYPSLVLSSYSPVSALKSIITVKQKGVINLRSSLVIFQFSLSIILIVSAIVVMSQLNYIKSFNLGYEAENLIYIELPGQSKQLHEPFSNEILKIPGVAKLTKADKPPFWGGNSSWGYDWEGKDPELKVLICAMWVDKNYFDVMGIPLKDGKTFSERFVNYSLEEVENVDVILNAEAIRRMKMEDPVGKYFGRGDTKGTIVGVTEDFNFETLKRGVEPLLLLPLQNEPNVIIAKIRKDNIHGTIESIEQAWKKINPASPFSFGFFDDRLESNYRGEVRISKLFRYFTFIAIFIASLGLLGLSSFSIQRKTKEIGIRKVVGAPVSSILVLLTRDFVRWVLIAFVIACPIAWYTMQQWLENFAYKTNLNWGIFIVSGLLALFVALFTVSFQTIRASLKNPVDSLRYE